MIKKIIIIPVCFFVLVIFEIACNNCKDLSEKKHISITKHNNLSLQTHNGISVLSNNNVTLDSLFISALQAYQINCIAKSNFSFFSSSYARKISCPCGDNGFTNPIKKLVFTSNATFNGVAAGSSLNNFIEVKRDYAQQVYRSPEAFIDSVNVMMARFSSDQSVIANEFIFNKAKVLKPSTAFSGKFISNYILQNGDTLKSETISINWQ
jgi:hypothetical protein